MIATVQVLAMALWFSASAVVPSLRVSWHVSTGQATLLTSSVQIGFVVGAVASALLNIADLVPAPRLIAVSAVCGATANGAVALWAHNLAEALPLRVLTGVALAGVYPVGLKLMASWFRRGRGLALAVLVAALTLGSSVPQLVNGASSLSPRDVLLTSSALALIGAMLAAVRLEVGPNFLSTPAMAPGYVVHMFRDRSQRLINFGYLGHMWELYAMWTWLPALIAASHLAATAQPETRLSVGTTSFLIVGVAGAIGCVAGGSLAGRFGSVRVAEHAMLISGTCALAAAATYATNNVLFLGVLTVWGGSVIADSAQLSTALTEAADTRYVGTALTAQTAAGFLLTVVTIQGVPVVVHAAGWRVAVCALSIGPFIGRWALRTLRTKPLPTPLSPDDGLENPRTRW